MISSGIANFMLKHEKNTQKVFPIEVVFSPKFSIHFVGKGKETCKNSVSGEKF